MIDIYAKLCTYDERSPYYVDLYECNEQPEARRKDCMCDNCFYGRDELAREVIILREALEAISRTSDTVGGGAVDMRVIAKQALRDTGGTDGGAEG